MTTVIDIDNRPMARAVSPQMSGYILGLHTAAGAEVILNTSVEEIEGCDGTVQSVRLASGEKIAADVVLIGIGAAPNVDLALGASLQVDNGILADEYLTTSDSDISAIVTVRRSWLSMVSEFGLSQFKTQPTKRVRSPLSSLGVHNRTQLYRGSGVIRATPSSKSSGWSRVAVKCSSRGIPVSIVSLSFAFVKESLRALNQSIVRPITWRDVAC